MKAILCDGCGATMEDGEVLYGDYAAQTDRARLTISMATDLDLCPDCCRKAYYKVAKEAFRYFVTPKAKKAKAPAEI